jgi:ferredoxin-thioredoxin reductase catalytic subunit
MDNQQKEQKLRQMARDCGLVVNEDNIAKIVSAKSLLFKNNWLWCPCDRQNPERSCISDTCREDIERDGHCHCNLFLKGEADDEYPKEDLDWEGEEHA